MVRVLLTIILFLFILHAPAMSEEQSLSPELLEKIESRALRPYFNALKSGNMQLLMNYTTGKKRKDIQWSLDRDKEYAQFLRDIYKDAEFSVVGGITTDEGVIVTVRVAQPGDEYHFRFTMQQQKGGAQSAGVGNWLITEEPNASAE